MTGSLAIVGLGPGDTALLTQDALRALERATDIVGYETYVARVRVREGQRVHASDNRVELDRARHALHLAAAGHDVAVVSSGDPNVFAMASAVFEALQRGDPAWSELPIEVVPGISALFAAAARLGAPLGSDFCAISLSDNLKPWDLIARRIKAAAEADFVLALYNPASHARRWQLGAAFEILRAVYPPSVPVAFVRAVTRPDENLVLDSLGDADPARADMRTLVLIGSRQTQWISRPGGGRWLYTPRFAADHTR
jgi:precorrin-3B C17-methyltransferase